MIITKNINWYIEEPSRLVLKKPFTRDSDVIDNNNYGEKVTLTTKSQAEFSNIKMNPISQDIYLQEYDPSMHRIKYNRSIPHIAVKVGNDVINIDDMTMTAAYQKNIHANHVQHLAIQPMDFTLCNSITPKKGILNKIKEAFVGSEIDDMNKRFNEVKQQWILKNMENIKYEVISKQQKCADVGLLYIYDKSSNKLTCKVLSYDDGYIVIPNYDEYGEKIACSIYYQDDSGNKVIDTYDDTNHYRFTEDQDGISDSGWVMTKEIHGFSRCPLLYKRGKVAWEYAESTIEMWELMTNINAVARKRFGTFGLVITGELDSNSFQKDASTLVINLHSDTGAGKQDAKTIQFPEPQKMIEYLDYLETKISIFSSVSFITPNDIKNTGSGGNGIYLAMKNDLALATQSAAEWSGFTNDMIALFQEGISLESGVTNRYTDLNISAKLHPWFMESDTTKISNLAIESKWLSKQSIIEKSPDAAPDEMERIERELGKMLQDNINANKDTSTIPIENAVRNNDPAIQDPTNKQTNSNT